MNEEITKEELEELSTEYALLKGLGHKNFEDLKRLKALEELITP